LYGTPEPDVLMAHVGDQVQAVLGIQCDIFNELYRGFFGGGSSGSACNNCGRLSLQAVFGDERAYSAMEDTLLLISVAAYNDLARGAQLGWYTVVDEFARLPISQRKASAR